MIFPGSAGVSPAQQAARMAALPGDKRQEHHGIHMMSGYLGSLSTCTPGVCQRTMAVAALATCLPGIDGALTPHQECCSKRRWNAAISLSNVVLRLHEDFCSLNLHSMCTPRGQHHSTLEHLAVPVHRHPIISYLHAYGNIHDNWLPAGIKQS
jgi:hypothetical protein